MSEEFEALLQVKPHFDRISLCLALILGITLHFRLLS
jgi:hypothetical protein